MTTRIYVTIITKDREYLRIPTQFKLSSKEASHYVKQCADRILRMRLTNQLIPWWYKDVIGMHAGRVSVILRTNGARFTKNDGGINPLYQDTDGSSVPTPRDYETRRHG